MTNRQWTPKQFWMVVAADGASTTSKRYETLEAAMEEAKQFALNNYGMSFMVLQTIGWFSPEKPSAVSWDWFG